MRPVALRSYYPFVNKVILVGQVGQQPEIDSSRANPIATFTVSLVDKWRTDTGHNQRTTWVRCLAYGEKARLAQSLCAKSRKVIVEGRLANRKHRDPMTDDGYCLEVVVANIESCAANEDSES